MPGVERSLRMAVIAGAALMVAACQTGPGGPGGPGGSVPVGTAASLPPPPSPSAVTTPRAAAAAGLSVYKVYNTTENLCARTCSAEARCQQHSFQPLSTINGYVAGQCQLMGK